MRPAIKSEKLSPTLTISECHPTTDHKGAFWLYDNIQGMNLAMGELTRENALLHALNYYQNRCIRFENDYKSLQKKVDTFVNQFIDSEKRETNE